MVELDCEKVTIDLYEMVLVIAQWLVGAAKTKSNQKLEHTNETSLFPPSGSISLLLVMQESCRKLSVLVENQKLSFC